MDTFGILGMTVGMTFGITGLSFGIIAWSQVACLKNELDELKSDLSTSGLIERQT